MQKFTFNNQNETEDFAKKLAKSLKATNVVRLLGTLGSGKSVIARTIIKELGTKEKHIPSPTYTLVQAYNDTTIPIAHMDLYRLEEADEVFDLDIEYYLENGILLIEWPQIADIHLPKNCITIEFEESEENSNSRTITLHGIEI
jgi:tRNA threonylcarbamoyl adenosine modification protein YjeE